MGEDNKGSLGGVRVELEGPGRVAVRRETRESLAEVRAAWTHQPRPFVAATAKQMHSWTGEGTRSRLAALVGSDE